MIFLTFHNASGDEIKLKIDYITGFISYGRGGHAVLMVGETENPIIVLEDWNYFVTKMKELEEATKQAMISGNVMRKFNGQG